MTLETADIPSVKIDNIEVKHASIEQEIRNGAHTYKYVSILDLPDNFEGFMWRMKHNTMIAIRGNNLSFQVVILRGHLPKFLSNMQAIRNFRIRSPIKGIGFGASRTEESIRLTKTINNTEAKITLDAKIIC